MLSLTIAGDPYTLDERGFAHAVEGKDAFSRIYDTISPSLAPSGYYPSPLLARAAAVVALFGGEITGNDAPDEPEPDGEIVD